MCLTPDYLYSQSAHASSPMGEGGSAIDIDHFLQRGMNFGPLDIFVSKQCETRRGPTHTSPTPSPTCPHMVGYIQLPQMVEYRAHGRIIQLRLYSFINPLRGIDMTGKRNSGAKVPPSTRKPAYPSPYARNSTSTR